jgi:hypothetical protein
MKTAWFNLFLLAIIGLTSCSDDAPDVTNKPADKSAADTVQAAAEGAYYEYKILPQTTDVAIKASSEPHYAYLDTRISLKYKLVLFIGGTKSFPSAFQQFCKTASGLGYHVINVNYPNTISTLVCADKTDTGCFENFRKEILFGSNTSGYVNVDPTNSIVNRALKLLQYLHQQHPTQGWNRYFTGNTLNYSSIIAAGHSQGGGHAAYLAYLYPMSRLVMLSAPADYSEKYMKPAPWCSRYFKTPRNQFFGLMHKRDEIVLPSEIYAIWKAMGMFAATDTSSADKPTYINYKALYTNYDPNPAAPTARLKHNVPAMDITLPAGDKGVQLKKVWVHMLKD